MTKGRRPHRYVFLNPFSRVEPWSDVAAGYKESTQPFLALYARHALELVNPSKADSALDVAAGPGTLALLLSPLVKRVDAVDFSPPMIEGLKSGIADQGIVNVHPVVMDGQSLGFADNSFQCAYSMFGLMFFPDILKGMKEMLRVLKPGGRAAISSWAPIDHSPLMQMMFGAIKAAIPDTPAPRNNIGSLENPDFFRASMMEAGFTDVQIVPSVRGMDITDPEPFFASMLNGSAPMQMMKKRMSRSEWETKRAIMLDHVKKTLPPLPAHLSSQAWIGIGKKK